MQSSQKREHARQQRQQELQLQRKLQLQQRVEQATMDVEKMRRQNLPRELAERQIQQLSKEIESISFLLMELMYDEIPPPQASSHEPAMVQQPIKDFKQAQFEYALSYVSRVREIFVNKPEVPIQFIAICDKLRSGRLSIVDVRKRIKQLFEGHPELLLGFNRFLPPGFEIAVKTSEPPPAEIPAEDK